MIIKLMLSIPIGLVAVVGMHYLANLEDDRLKAFTYALMLFLLGYGILTIVGV